MGAFDKILIKLKIYVDLNPTVPFLDVLDKIRHMIKPYLFFTFNKKKMKAM